MVSAKHTATVVLNQGERQTERKKEREKEAKEERQKGTSGEGKKGEKERK